MAALKHKTCQSLQSGISVMQFEWYHGKRYCCSSQEKLEASFFIQLILSIKSVRIGEIVMEEKTTMNMMAEVSQRIREMRELLGFSTAEMAAKTEVSEEEYIAYENAQKDLPFSFLHKCSLTFGLDIKVLLKQIIYSHGL